MPVVRRRVACRVGHHQPVRDVSVAVQGSQPLLPLAAERARSCVRGQMRGRSVARAGESGAGVACVCVCVCVRGGMVRMRARVPRVVVANCRGARGNVVNV